MVQLKADPWRPDHGMGAEVSFEDEPTKAVVDPAVETTDWSRPIAPDPCPPRPFIFVDGVMRTELRVMASDSDKRAWGLLGSFAAGGVLCDSAATFVAEERPVGRALILGSRIDGGADFALAELELRYRHHAVADDSPTGLRRSLQRLMLAAEQELAAELAATSGDRAATSGDRAVDAIVFADGPLHIGPDTKAEVVGVVKRMVKPYLEGEQAALLARLGPGQRTPVFALGNQAVDRYAWYVRLIPQDPAWHELAGLVRCEVRMELGLGRAVSIADEVACHLPRFAGRPGVDPRAPQNLTPVGALEARLKHRLGSSTVIGRALLQRIAEGNGHA